MIFSDPLWLLCLIPLFGMMFFHSRIVLIPTILFSDVSVFKEIEHKSTKYMSFISRYLRYFILILIVLTLARPQSVHIQREMISEGIDIMMVLDVSQSMAAEDLQPTNRLEVAKNTMKTFVSQRQGDRIGLVVFGSDAYTQCPLTTDYDILGGLFDDIHLSMAGDGTAIGMAIATGLNRLKSSDSKSKIMILLTDGENNVGELDPLRAAELARDLGVKIYTIGVGQEGGAPVPFEHPVYGKVYSNYMTYLDEDTLKSISRETNGYYFRAVDSDSLETIYSRIDNLEKTEIKSNQYTEFYDFFPTLLMWILILILLELIVFNSVFVVSP
ncbi:aerotolerance regulator BatA [Candidatus Marinamargulisbacteria bacterium SCGC AG-343-D04]|nr:aerotolerance regulator BatA [Candidatus Marinamargulisbacteria bacterium SCGC AG-343-D04]